MSSATEKDTARELEVRATAFAQVRLTDERSKGI